MWVCVLLQRFQRAGVKEKGHDADEGDAVAVGPGLFVWIAGHNDLPEGDTAIVSPRPRNSVATSLERRSALDPVT